MAYRNVRRQDQEKAYYHVYNRGVAKQVIFHDEQDYRYFKELFTRYLGLEQKVGKDGAPYPHLYSRIELLCYCLMPNHFHLLVYQRDKGSLILLMRSLITSYSRYYNLRYSRRGALFETRYKAAIIANDSYLQHISRYIHCNPRSWEDYPYSSISFYLTRSQVDWLKPAKITSLFNSSKDYLDFLNAYRPNSQTSEL